MNYFYITYAGIINKNVKLSNYMNRMTQNWPITRNVSFDSKSRKWIKPFNNL